MPRVGEVYQLPSPPSPYQPNTNASATDVNTSINDIATALTGSASRAGATMTGTLTLFADPAANLQAATKQYVDGVRSYVQGNYLPFTGGTLTGNLTINTGSAWTTQVLTSAAGQGSQIIGQTGSSYRSIIVLRDGSSESGSNAGSNFSINMYSDAGAYLTTPFQITRSNGYVTVNNGLGVNGGLYTNGYTTLNGGCQVNNNLTANYVHNTGAEQIDGSATINGSATIGGALTVGGNGIAYSTIGGNQHRWGWDGSFITGYVDATYVGQMATVGWTNGAINSAVGGYLPLGGGTITGSLTVNNNATINGTLAGGTVQAYAAGFQLFRTTAGRYMQFSSSWNWQWNESNGDLFWNDTGGNFWYFRQSDHLAYNVRASTGGNGAYVNVSDARVKDNITDSTVGLEAVLGLRPKSFRRKGQAGVFDRVEHGFVADEVETVMPHAVVAIGSETEPNLRAMTLDPIVAALVNAVRALHERIIHLEASAPIERA